MKIALIGCGLWGRVILRDLLDLDVQTIVVDPVEARRAEALRQGACLAHADLESLEPVDGVVVATPATTHADVVLGLDRSGSTAPIFCEKPLADGAANARRLLERDGPRLYVMHIWRHHPGVRKLRELVRSGVIGTLTRLHSIRTNWTSPRRDIDALGNLAPHDLSIFQYLLGVLPPPLFAVPEVIDGTIVGCTAILGEPDGPPCIFEVSNRYAEKRREIRVHGTEGVLVLPDDVQGAVQLVRGGGTITADHVETFAYEKRSALQSQLSAFLELLETGSDDSLCPAVEGAEVVFAIERIRDLAQRVS